MYDRKDLVKITTLTNLSAILRTIKKMSGYAPGMLCQNSTKSQIYVIYMLGGHQILQSFYQILSKSYFLHVPTKKTLLRKAFLSKSTAMLSHPIKIPSRLFTCENIPNEKQPMII